MPQELFILSRIVSGRSFSKLFQRSGPHHQGNKIMMVLSMVTTLFNVLAASSSSKLCNMYGVDVKAKVFSGHGDGIAVLQWKVIQPARRGIVRLPAVIPAGTIRPSILRSYTADVMLLPLTRGVIFFRCDAERRPMRVCRYAIPALLVQRVSPRARGGADGAGDFRFHRQ